MLKSYRIVCLGCGMHNGGSPSRYCSTCEKITCSVCGSKGVKVDICIQCRRARGSKE